MKKLFYFLSITAVLMTSCSSDDDNNPSADVVLLKKTIDTDSDGEVSTTTFTYNGRKILKDSSDDGSYSTYTYTGDLITKRETFVDDELYQTDLYEYNSDQKLTVHTKLSHVPGWGNKYVFTHNADDTISFNSYIGDLDSQTGLNDTGRIHFTNGEISRIESDEINSQYLYDDKNNPFKNVTGMDKLSFTHLEASGIQKNITLWDDSFSGQVATTYTYAYNAGNYPETSVENYAGDETTTQYFYN